MADDSILNGTKRALGIEPAYTQFDPEITMHINAAFGTLNQIGVGPIQGFYVEDDSATWSSFLSDDPRLNSAKQYVQQKVRLAFDPPSTSFVLAAFEKNLTELEYRLELATSINVPLVDLPVVVPPVVIDDGIRDGGNPSSSGLSRIVYDGGTP